MGVCMSDILLVVPLRLCNLGRTCHYCKIMSKPAFVTPDSLEQDSIVVENLAMAMFV